jgi:ADP-heptose:LPS heptosyltransferase/predicted  nucleic acid-binding Zn-ribbon protein
MKVLVLRTDAIGDFIVFIPVLKVLRTVFRGDELTLLARDNATPLIENSPYCNSIISFDFERYVSDSAYKLELEHTLEEHRYDMVINAMYSRSPVSDAIVRSTGAPVRIGFHCLDRDGNELVRQANEKFYNVVIQQTAEFMPELARNMSLIETLGWIDTEQVMPEVRLRDEDLTFAEDFCRSHSIDPKKPSIILFPGAGAKIRQWPVENFSSLAKRLQRELGAQIILSAGPMDVEPIEELKRSLRDRDIPLLNQDLRKQAAVYKKVSLFIGNETGPLQLAVAVGTPAIVVLGGGFGDRFFPYPSDRWKKLWHPMSCYHCFWKCIYSEPKCITSITTDEVFKVSKELLATNRRARKPKSLSVTGDRGTAEKANLEYGENANNRLGFLSFQIAAWRKAYEEVSEERSFWKTNYQILEGERENSKNNFEALSKMSDGWRRSYEAAGRDREHWKNNFETLSEDLRQWRNNYELLEKDRDGWKANYESLQRDRENWKNNFEALSQELKQWRTNYELLEKDREGWKRNYEVLETDRENYKKNFEVLFGELKEWRRNYEVLETDREEWRRNYETLQRDRENWKHNFEALSEELKQWRTNYEMLETDRNRWKDASELLQKEKDELSKTLSDLLGTPFIKTYFKLFGFLKRQKDV